MNKFAKRMVGLTLGLALVGGVGTSVLVSNSRVVKANADSTSVWSRVTSVADLLKGGTAIIGYEATAKSGTIVPMQNTGSATTSAAGYLYSGATSGSSSSDTIDMSSLIDTSKYEVTITASTIVEGAICIKIGDSFVGNTNTKNNLKLFDSEATTTAFTPLLDTTNDVFTLKIAANKESYQLLQYNSDNPRFAVYKSGQKNVVIYRATAKDWANHFISTTATACADPTLDNRKAVEGIWADTITKYNQLNSEEKALVKAATYEDENLGAAVKRYDTIISRYASESTIISDYIGRAESSGKNSSIITGDTNTAIAIAAVVTLVSVSAIGGYFFVKKTKHE